MSKAPTLLRSTSKCNRQTLQKSRGQVLKNVLKLGVVIRGKCNFLIYIALKVILSNISFKPIDKKTGGVQNPLGG